MQRAKSITIDEDEYLALQAENLKLNEQMKLRADTFDAVLEDNNTEYNKLQADFDECIKSANDKEEALMNELAKAHAQLTVNCDRSANSFKSFKMSGWRMQQHRPNMRAHRLAGCRSRCMVGRSAGMELRSGSLLIIGF